MDAIIVATHASRYNHIYCHVLSGFRFGKFEARMMVMRIMTRERQRKTPRPNFCLGFIWDFWRTRMGMLMTVVSERGMLISWFPFVFSVVFGKGSGERGRKRRGIFTHHVRNDVEDCSQNVQIQKNVSVIEAFNYSRKRKKITFVSKKC